MQRLFAFPKGRLAKADPATQDWVQATHALIAGYFAGERSAAELNHAIHGQPSFRLMSYTAPGTQEWSLLMSALDVLADGVDGVRPPMEQVKRLSHGVVSYDEYVETLFPPKVEKKARHSW